jgi:hypothetical protein
MIYFCLFIFFQTCNSNSSLEKNNIDLKVNIVESKIDSAFEMILELNLVIKNITSKNLKIKPIDNYELVFAFSDTILFPDEIQIVFYNRNKRFLNNVSYDSFGSLKYARHIRSNKHKIVKPKERIIESYKFGFSNIRNLSTSRRLFKGDYYFRLFFPLSIIAGNENSHKAKNFIKSNFIKFTIK